MSWPRGRWFPVFRPYTPVSPLGIPAKIQIRETCTKIIADECGHIDLIVKKYPGGKASTYLHSLTPGESLRFALVLRGYRWIPNKYTHVTLIAGGAGITPFLAILRQLHREKKAQGNSLFFSNKTVGDIIEHQELLDILGVSANFILSKDDTPGYFHTRIDKTFLKEQVSNFKQPFYICGPDQMVADLTNTLKELGADPESVVFEK